jgi:FkbM family methyltransferase
MAEDGKTVSRVARPQYVHGPVPPPPHTLPWWTRFDRRSTMSLAKRLTGPRARRLAERIPGVRMVSRRFLRHVERTRVTVCGAPFRLDVMRRSVSRSVFLGGRWHSAVVAILRAHVQPGMTVADVGANVGFMAVHMGDRAGPDGTVLAFEPEPRNFAILRENARNARWRNVVPIHAAIGAGTGTASLWLSPRDGGDHRTVSLGGDDRASVKVPLTSLDAVARARRVEIHFVKMDIQGAEGEALRGMEATLASRALHGIVLEFWPEALRRAGEDPEAILRSIRAAGLSCASHPAIDDDVPGFLAGVPAHGSHDLLFLRR